MILETVCVGPMQVNCYILALSGETQAIIIDPGAEENKIRKVLDRHKLKPACIINTHGHIDHIGCNDKFGVEIYVHRQDLALLKNPEFNLSSFFALPYRVNSKIKTVEDKDELGLGGIILKVIHVPGHTPGGISLLLEKPKKNILFTGDSLLCGGIGRTDFPQADGNLLLKSIKEKLLTLDEDILIYPGHGPTSTIGDEKRHNPLWEIVATQG